MVYAPRLRLSNMIEKPQNKAIRIRSFGTVYSYRNNKFNRTDPIDCVLLFNSNEIWHKWNALQRHRILIFVVFLAEQRHILITVISLFISINEIKYLVRRRIPIGISDFFILHFFNFLIVSKILMNNTRDRRLYGKITGIE